MRLPEEKRKVTMTASGRLQSFAAESDMDPKQIVTRSLVGPIM